MGSIDLSTSESLKYSVQSIDDGVATITFRDGNTDAVLGSIIMAANRLRGFLRHLEVVSEELTSSFDENYVTLATYDPQSGEGVVQFAPPPPTRM